MKQDILPTFNNTFGLNLFKLICEDLKGENAFISPISILAALSMIQLGARKNTAQEIAQVLGWKVEDGEQTHKLFQEFLTSLRNPSDQCQLSTANRIYLDKTFTVLEDFKNKTKEWYLADAVQANFKENAEEESAKINSWVEEQTQNKIKDLLSLGVLTPDTKMVLVNAIYFKGSWGIQFKKEYTEPRPFKLASGEIKEVPMMFNKQIYGLYRDHHLKFSAVELLYKDEEHSMIIILPREDYGLDITSSHKLNQPLSRLGMMDAFNISSADFSGITGQRDLVLSEIVHKAFVKVNEEGTEAAAATEVEILLCESPEIYVDHPFLFFIVDWHLGGSVLFMGQVHNPSD